METTVSIGQSDLENIDLIAAPQATEIGIDPARWPSHHQLQEECPLDHFITRDGITFAGTHLILDLWQASDLDDLHRMEQALQEAVEVCGATLLHIHLHHFTPNSGISGVAVLAESHISVHTWPEKGYAAFDVFMCGDARPELSIEVFKRAFRPQHINIHEHLRGASEA
jgi:S-adenosylmethionine decarboxylase